MPFGQYNVRCLGARNVRHYLLAIEAVGSYTPAQAALGGSGFKAG